MDTRPVPLTAKRVDGAEYSLPALELEFAVTRRMVDCTSTTSPIDASQVLAPKFEVTVEPKQELVAAETFSMDYASLSKPWKTSKLTIDWYENRMLKSINVSATDKSVDIAVEVLKTGLSVAKLAGGIPVPAGLAGASVAGCPAEVTTRKQAVGDRNKAQAELAKQTAIVAAFNARDAAKLSAKDKKALGVAIGAAKAQTDAIGKIEKELAELDKVLAFTETVRWRPPSAAGSTTSQERTFDFAIPDQPVTSEEQARARWIKRLFNVDDVKTLGLADRDCEKDLGSDGEPKQTRCRLQVALALQVRLEPEGQGAGADQLSVAQDALGLKPQRQSARLRRDHVAGVVTRIPARARFLACSGSGAPCQRSSSTKLFDQVISVPQFGHYLVLPFSNGIGEDNQLTASFAENGMPTSVTYEDKQAAALIVAKGINQGADAVLGYADQVRAAEKGKKDEADAAPLKALENQAKMLEQQKNIIAYQSVIDPTNAALAPQKAKLEIQLSMLTTQKQIAELEIQIAQLQTKAQADPADYAVKEQIERLQAQQSMLTAQVAIFEQCTKTPTLPACAN
jgi:hypothetical protein